MRVTAILCLAIVGCASTEAVVQAPAPPVDAVATPKVEAPTTTEAVAPPADEPRRSRDLALAAAMAEGLADHVAAEERRRTEERVKLDDMMRRPPSDPFGSMGFGAGGLGGLGTTGAGVGGGGAVLGGTGALGGMGTAGSGGMGSGGSKKKTTPPKKPPAPKK